MMHLLPWKAGREHRVVDSLRREFNQLFDRFWSGQLEPTALSRWVPAIDVSETDDCVAVAAEVPGLQAHEINVSVEGNVLTLRGEKKSNREEKQENYHRIERQYGAFTRSIQLPTEVDVDRVEAVFRNGVLEITLPKREDARPKQIRIDVKP